MTPKLQPIENVGRKWWRLWSQRLSAIGIVLQSIFIGWASVPVEIWNFMPAEVKAILPPWAMFGLPMAFFIAAWIARLIKQPKLNKEADGE